MKYYLAFPDVYGKETRVINGEYRTKHQAEMASADRKANGHAFDDEYVSCEFQPSVRFPHHDTECDCHMCRFMGYGVV